MINQESETLINTAMFELSRDTGVAGNGRLELFQGYYGELGARYFHGLERGKISADKPFLRVAGAIDKVFFEAFRIENDLPKISEGDDIYVRNLYIQHQDIALAAMEWSLTELIPTYTDTHGLKNEVRSDSPSDHLRLLGHPKIDIRRKFEVQRHILLTAIATKYSMGSMQSPYVTELNRIQFHLNEKLYEYFGTGRQGDVFTYHDNDTNAALGLMTDFGKPPENSHLKQTPVEVRTVKEIGDIGTDPHAKRPLKAVIKAIEEALAVKEEVKTIKPCNLVTDPFGMRFIVRDRTLILPMIDRVLEAMKGYRRKIIDVIEDNEVSELNGKKRSLGFERRQVYLEGLTAPWEIIFEDQITHLDSQLEVGKKGKDGFWDGTAHELYDMIKYLPVLYLLYPIPIYRRDPRAAVTERMDEKVFELRERYKVEPVWTYGNL